MKENLCPNAFINFVPSGAAASIRMLCVTVYLGITAAPIQAQLVYIGLSNNTIETARINPNGSLTQIGSPAALPAGPMVVTPWVSQGTPGDHAGENPASRFLYVLHGGSPGSPGSVSGYSIGPLGALTAIGATMLPPRVGAELSMTADPFGNFLFVGRYNGLPAINPVAFRIGSDGVLTLAPSQVDTVPRAFRLAVHPTGKFLYAEYVNSVDAQSIIAHRILSDGSLQQIGSAVPAGHNPYPLVIDSTGRFLYLASDPSPGFNPATNQILEYAIGADGGLTSIGATGEFPENVFDMIADPNGRYIYVSQGAGSRHIQTYRIGPTGALTATGPMEGQGGLMAVDPAGRFLYELFGNVVTGYRILPNGSLNPVGSLSLSVPGYALLTTDCHTGEDARGCH